MYAADLSTLDGSLPENAPPPWGANPPYVSTMILRPVNPVSPSGPPMTNLPVGLIKNSVLSSINSAGNTPTITSLIWSLTWSIWTASACWVEHTILSIRLTVLSSLYSIVTWDLESGPNQGNVPCFLRTARISTIRCE